LDAGLVEPLDAGLDFDAGLAALVVDLVLDFAAAAFTAVFLVSFFALVVFFVDGFLAVTAFLVVAGAFLGAAGFFVEALSVDGLVLLVAAFFTGTAFLVSGAFFAGAGFLDGGLVFSLVSADVLGRLGASLTLPEGPLGKTNVSFSAPRVSAKLS